MVLRHHEHRLNCSAAHLLWLGGATAEEVVVFLLGAGLGVSAAAKDLAAITGCQPHDALGLIHGL